MEDTNTPSGDHNISHRSINERWIHGVHRVYEL